MKPFDLAMHRLLSSQMASVLASVVRTDFATNELRLGPLARNLVYALILEIARGRTPFGSCCGDSQAQVHQEVVVLKVEGTSF